MSPVLVAFGVVLAIAVAGYVFGYNPVTGLENLLGPKLSAQEISQYASNAGFAGDDLTRAVAIALAESGGNPKAHGDQTLGSGTGSFGLWQIYSDAHPEFGPDFTQLYDPQTNANAAFSVYMSAGMSFTPWSTFKNDAYLAHINDASSATGFPV